MMEFITMAMAYGIFAFIFTVLTAYAYHKTKMKIVVLPLIVLLMALPIILYNHTYITYSGWESQNNIFLTNTNMITSTYLDDSGYHTHTMLAFSGIYTISNQRLYAIDFDAHSVTVAGTKNKIFTGFGGYIIPIDNHAAFTIDGETFTPATMTFYPTRDDVYSTIVIIFALVGFTFIIVFDVLNNPITRKKHIQTLGE